MTTPSLAPVLRFLLDERGWPFTDGLQRLSECLPPVPTAGLEVPLSGVGSVDLQQRIRGPSEVHRLIRWLASRRAVSPAWQRLREAIEVVDPLIEEFWLELDASPQDPPLSVFVRFGDASLAESNATARRMIEVFDLAMSTARQSALERCLDACGRGGRLTHLGLMLGRAGSPIRLVIEGVPPQDIGDFLIRTGWRGNVAEVQGWTDALFVHADRIRLAMTLANELTPDIGLECFVGDPCSSDPRWRCLFDLLVARAVCSGEQRDRLLAWPCVITPLSARNWPEALVVDALLRADAASRWIECRLSHIKLSLAPGRPASAKGYVGFLEVEDSQSEGSAIPPAGRPVGLDAAIESAIGFLLRQRSQAGWWRDFEGFVEGAADEWITAYVAHALHMSGRPQALEAAGRAWDLLASRARFGWGWNFLQPADADSTVWGLQLAVDLGRLNTPQASGAIDFLRQHVLPDGGVATYRRDCYQEWVGSAEANSGWFTEHVCVTAAAAQLACLHGAPLRHLRKTQQADGCWRSYWWESDAYATALAAEALIQHGLPEDAERVARAVLGTCLRLDAKGTATGGPLQPFEAALSLRTMLVMPSVEAGIHAARLRQALLDMQLEDGSWTASAALSIPNSRGGVVAALDKRRLFTTATVLVSLLKLQKVGSP